VDETLSFMTGLERIVLCRTRQEAEVMLHSGPNGSPPANVDSAFTQDAAKMSAAGTGQAYLSYARNTSSLLSDPRSRLSALQDQVQQQERDLNLLESHAASVKSELERLQAESQSLATILDSLYAERRSLSQ